MSQFPLEIWYKILQNLDKGSVKEMSLVSQALHKEALHILFGCVDLWFGRFPFRQEGEPTIGVEWDDAQEEDETSRSLGILLRISENAALAQSINRLRVIAPVVHAMVLERYHISRALDKLINLQRFEWIGEGFSGDTAKKLRAGLSGVYITQLNDLAGKALQGLTGLREFRLIDVNKSSASIGTQVSLEPSTINAIFENNRNTLKHVALSGPSSWGSNLLRLSDSLTHLDVNNAGQCEGLDLYLRHADTLESLTLLDLLTLRFLPEGAEGKDLLPKLKDLKLQMDYPTGLGQFELLKDSQILLSFIGYHRRLERFDFSLWPNHRDWIPEFFSITTLRGRTPLNASWFSNIIRSIQQLDGVKALGVSFPSMAANDMEHLLAELCASRALRQCTALRISGVDKVPLHPIVDSRLSSLENLSFLALHNARPFEECDGEHRLPAADDFVYTYKCPSIQAVCLMNKIFTIDHASRRFLPYKQWSEERIRLRKESDFFSADAYWLMSYRSLSDQFDYAPMHPESDSESDELMMNLGW